MYTGPCAKQRVRATIVLPSGFRVRGENDCRNPQETCPREGMKTGEGYELCREICDQTGHAEENAIANAKKLGFNVDGSKLVLEGHTYACDNCKAACEAAGISEIIIGPATN